MKTLNETLQPREVNATFENSIFKIILMLVHENCCTSMQFSLKFVPACLSNIQSGISPGMHPANERCRYNVTKSPSLPRLIPIQYRFR